MTHPSQNSPFPGSPVLGGQATPDFEAVLAAAAAAVGVLWNVEYFCRQGDFWVRAILLEENETDLFIFLEKNRLFQKVRKVHKNGC